VYEGFPYTGRLVAISPQEPIDVVLNGRGPKPFIVQASVPEQV
jgi:hypothetical protein